MNSQNLTLIELTIRKFCIQLLTELEGSRLKLVSDLSVKTENDKYTICISKDTFSILDNETKESQTFDIPNLQLVTYDDIIDLTDNDDEEFDEFDF